MRMYFNTGIHPHFFVKLYLYQKNKTNFNESKTTMNRIIFMGIALLSLGILSWYMVRNYWCKCSNKKLEIGKKAFNFTLPDQNGIQRALTDFLGKKVVLYFYPKDDTPGCTKQACSFRDTFDQYKAKEITVIGISYDSSDSHKSFEKKHQLPFLLLSDSGKQVTRAYGIAGTLFANRITFLINEQGIVIDRIDSVDVNSDAASIIKRFEK